MKGLLTFDALSLLIFGLHSDYIKLYTGNQIVDSGVGLVLAPNELIKV